MSQSKTIGLISDTHMPDRWAALPERVYELFAEVDLIIHAGDIGELWVLDQLGEIAPVVSVHGNDEPEHIDSALPYLQTLSINGHRMVVTHAHYPNRAEEIASRVEAWDMKLKRRARFAATFGASICIFGHTHIPMHLTYDDVLLVNPGAIASGNPWMRQLIQTVVLMTLETEQAPHVTHYDLATGEPHTPFFDNAGFSATATRYQATIFEDHFLPHRDFVWYQLRLIDMKPIHHALLSICHEVWAGERDIITTEALMERFTALHIPEVDDALRQHDYFSQYL